MNNISPNLPRSRSAYERWQPKFTHPSKHKRGVRDSRVSQHLQAPWKLRWTQKEHLTKSASPPSTRRPRCNVWRGTDVPFVSCLTRALRHPALLVVKGEQPFEANCGISEDRPSVWELAKSCCSNLRTEENSRAWQEGRHQEVRWKKFLLGWWPGYGHYFISVWLPFHFRLSFISGFTLRCVSRDNL